MFSPRSVTPIIGSMAKSRHHPEGKEPASFKPRRAVLPIGQPDEKRVVVRAYMPASLAKDITLYAIERDCSVSDLLNTIVRKAIPALKVIAVGDQTAGRTGSVTHRQTVEPIDRDISSDAEASADRAPPAAAA